MSEYIFLRVPHLGQPTATRCTDNDIREWSVGLFFTNATPRELAMDSLFLDLTAPKEDDDDPFAAVLRDLAERHGLDTVLYTAYSDGDEPEYSVQPLDEIEERKNYLCRDLAYGDFIALENVAATIEWLRGPAAPRIGRCGPVAAAAALEAAMGWAS